MAVQWYGSLNLKVLENPSRYQSEHSLLRGTQDIERWYQRTSSWSEFYGHWGTLYEQPSNHPSPPAFHGNIGRGAWKQQEHQTGVFGHATSTDGTSGTEFRTDSRGAQDIIE